MDTFTFTGRDGTEITAYRWEPARAPRALVQLTHGMGEHLLRYDRLAAALTARGYVVQGQDHRGHGATAGSPEKQGVLGEDGWAGLVDDIGVLVAKGKADHPGIPVILLGHSMGSFAAQQWVLDHSAEIDGLVLSGTGLVDLLEPSLDLDAEIDLSGFNAPFENRTGFEWLSRDEAEVDKYVADPACGFGLDQPGGKALFVAGRVLADPARVAAIRDDLPVLITVGDADPVNAGLALVNPLVDRLAAAGVKDVTLRVWPGARHEVFNETNREEITDDVVAWVDRVVG
ncbi:alpha/beta fold hydrolase [Pseudonocardia pini]|uniref:alpha/beta fold hydrolase n=1 Tax=Pseudonocardia pini TaxID=2758030 RepID=UPI0015EFE535|nr:alpha/beta hydrolase [Pseudonocardia pini]